MNKNNPNIFLSNYIMSLLERTRHERNEIKLGFDWIIYNLAIAKKWEPLLHNETPIILYSVLPSRVFTATPCQRELRKLNFPLWGGRKFRNSPISFARTFPPPRQRF